MFIVQRFSSIALLEPAEGGGVPAKEMRMYIHGRRTRIRKEQRQENYWKGDWPTFGDETRIIGRYDASSAKTANLGVSSVKRSDYRDSECGWVREGCTKGKPTRDHPCQWSCPWYEVGVG